MRWLYSALVRALLGPVWLVRWLRAGADRGEARRWRERVGLWQPPAAARGALVMHAASVGEVGAALPLVQALREHRPDLPIVLTCTSPTGSARIRSALGDAVAHVYLPFDTPGAAARFLERLHPCALVLLETELWPNLLAQARQQGIPTVLANARLSARSARGYARVAAVSRPMLAGLDLVLAQGSAAARRLVALGVPKANVQVSGNLKFDLELPTTLEPQVAPWRPVLAGRRVWVAGSTHPGEDERLLRVHADLRTRLPEALLILVPRHPERFDPVARELARSGLRFVRRSSGEAVTAATEVLLADSMGEMLLWFSLADVVFIGGSLIPRGGHNPLEAMACSRAIQSGPHVHNFAEAFRWLEQAQALTWVHNDDDLLRSTHDLLADPARCARLGARAHAVFAQHAGAAQRMARAILALLPSDGQGVRRLHNDGEVVWFDQAFFPQPPEEGFAPERWRAAGKVVGESTGRSTVWFIEHGGRQMVLRHYRRGGLFGKLVKDSFPGQAVASSRAMREFALLRRMHGWGLPVPRPCAARMQRRGRWLHGADIIVERVPQAVDVATLLREQRAMTAAEWRAVGASIRRLHDRGVHHSDLNCHNLLLDAQGVAWLIDFDKCEERAGQDWKVGNLARLLRSLRKEARLHAAFRWREPDWALLLDGYGPLPAGSAVPV